ncbi:hypothetical protein [Planctobacterium marinum]|uniref:hypothetical protein n=1 Tax=Planctobacterium marinum TaxID=1631968 RepID=UPI001E59A0C0|nr:hypothetical protein [Planctobacterium marinum]MCC2607764.1 hypothetical protein [Planctobacterium marinum]
MNSETQKSSVNHFMQLSIVVWLTLCLGFISSASSANQFADSGIYSESAVWQLAILPADASPETDADDDSIISTRLPLALQPGYPPLKHPSRLAVHEASHAFYARGPPL